MVDGSDGVVVSVLYPVAVFSVAVKRPPARQPSQPAAATAMPAPMVRRPYRENFGLLMRVPAGAAGAADTACTADGADWTGAGEATAAGAAGAALAALAARTGGVRGPRWIKSSGHQ